MKIEECDGNWNFMYEFKIDNQLPHTCDFSRELGDRTYEPIRSCINSQKNK